MEAINLDEKVSQHFAWREALWLPSWNRAAEEKDGLTQDVLNNLKKTFAWMDLVRNHFGKPVHVHCAYRPVDYNKAIGGALHSQHTLGCAVDFDVTGMSCDDVHKEIIDQGLLETWGLRMEKGTKGWIHLDSREPGPGGRYFQP